VKTIIKILTLLCLAFVFSCKDSLQIQSTEYERINIDSAIDKDKELEDIISPYREKINAEMDKPLSYNANAMFRTDTPDNTAIGNMMADAVLEMANPVFEQRYDKPIDAVLLNYGGIRAGMSKGVVTTRTAFQVMPFENTVVVAELDGEQMKQLIDFLFMSDEAHPVANMTLKFDAGGNTITQLINGKSFDESQTYHVATSNYLVEGGDNMNFFLKAKNTYDTDYKLRNLFIDYFSKKDTIDYSSDDRLIKLK